MQQNFTNQFQQPKQPQKEPNKKKLYFIIAGGVIVLLFLGVLIVKGLTKKEAPKVEQPTESSTHIEGQESIQKGEDADDGNTTNSSSSSEDNKNEQTTSDETGKVVYEVVPFYNAVKEENKSKYGTGEMEFTIYPQSIIDQANSNTSNSFYDAMSLEPISNTQNDNIYIPIATQQLYGFAAYKKDDGTWERITTITPIPSIDDKYKGYGGNTAQAEALVKEQKEKVEAILNKTNKTAEKFGQPKDKLLSYLEENNPVLESLDMSELNHLNKGTDTPKAVDIINSQLIKNKNNLHVPFVIKNKDFVINGVEKEGFDLLKEDEQYQINIDNNIDYFAVLRTETMKELNKETFDELKAIYNNAGTGVKLNHTIAVNGDFIIIDGVQYEKNKVILELYKTPQPNTTAENLLEGLQANNTQLFIEK